MIWRIFWVVGGIGLIGASITYWLGDPAPGTGLFVFCTVFSGAEMVAAGIWNLEFLVARRKQSTMHGP